MDTNMEQETKPQRGRRVRKGSAKKRKSAQRITAVALCAVAGVFAVTMGVLISSVPKDVIAKGVYADAIDLSGMTKEEAKSAIEGHEFFNIENISVESGGAEFDIPVSAVSLGIDSEKTAEKAFSIGKSGNKLSDARDVLIMRFSDKQTDIVPSIDEEALNAQLYEFAKQIHGELQEHSFEMGSDSVKVIPGKTGASPDCSQACEQVINAISGRKFSGISVSLNKEAPKELDLDALCNEVHADAKDAGFETTSKSAKVSDHVIGIDVDREDANDKISKIKEGGEPVEIKITKTMPKVTKDMLEDKLFNTTLSSFSTKYSASNTNRSANLALAASNMNGTVLAPGETFSYNEVVGERTAANGFKNAAVYENGKSVDGIGGGVCQVSTTLYSAVLYADLKVVSRQNHSLTVSYVPLGQDATVVDGAIDFKFQNNTDYPIKIVSSAGGGTIDVSIVGTKRDKERTVKLEHKTVSTTAPTTKEIKNSSLPEGTTKTVSKGHTGYVVESTKIVYENGEEVSRTSLGKSTYKMVPNEVEVGTAAAATQAPPPAAEQPAENNTVPRTNETIVQPKMPEAVGGAAAPAENEPAAADGN